MSFAVIDTPEEAIGAQRWEPEPPPVMEASKTLVDKDLVDRARALRASVAELIAATPELSSKMSKTNTAMTQIGRETVRTLVADVLDREALARAASSVSPLARGDERTLVELVLAMLFGLGPLQVFIDDETVENIDVNGAEMAFVTFANGKKSRYGPVAASDEELISIIRSAAARFGLSERRFDAGQPELDLRLPDGSRLSAVMGVTEHPVIDIRRHRLSDHSLGDLVGIGTVEEELAALLAAAVRAKRNILVSGAMNAGKTTLLRALAAEISPAERIVTIEQALELGLERQTHRHPDCVAMEARLANTEGAGAIGMAQLVRRSLRMNASRVIVREVLGDEVIPMLNAMSQGRSGSMATIHADDSAGVFRRLASYAVQSPARLPLEATNLLIAGAINFVVHLDNTAPLWPVNEPGPSGSGRSSRHVTSVREVVGAEGPLVVSNEIWKPGPDGRAVASSPLRETTLALLMAHGYQPRHATSMGTW